MPFLQTYLCGRGHETEHLHMGPRQSTPLAILCRECVSKVNSPDDGWETTDPSRRPIHSTDIVDEEMWLELSRKTDEFSTANRHGRATYVLIWNAGHQRICVPTRCLAFPVISTTTVPITINRRNGDYAAREKERLTKRSKEHNRLKTSREEADANTERVVGKDTANVLFSKGLHA